MLHGASTSRLADVSAREKRVEMKFQVVLEPSDEGGYTAYVPALPGCISEGDTIDEAMANIREAIELCLEPNVLLSRTS